METYLLQCPSCGQKLAVNGVTAQDDEEVACQTCGALLMMRFEGRGMAATVVRAPSGSPLGPAEGVRKERQ